MRAYRYGARGSYPLRPTFWNVRYSQYYCLLPGRSPLLRPGMHWHILQNPSLSAWHWFLRLLVLLHHSVDDYNQPQPVKWSHCRQRAGGAGRSRIFTHCCVNLERFVTLWRRLAHFPEANMDWQKCSGVIRSYLVQLVVRYAFFISFY